MWPTAYDCVGLFVLVSHISHKNRTPDVNGITTVSFFFTSPSSFGGQALFDASPPPLLLLLLPSLILIFLVLLHTAVVPLPVVRNCAQWERYFHNPNLPPPPLLFNQPIECGHRRSSQRLFFTFGVWKPERRPYQEGIHCSLSLSLSVWVCIGYVGWDLLSREEFSIAFIRTFGLGDMPSVFGYIFQFNVINARVSVSLP